LFFDSSSILLIVDLFEINNRFGGKDNQTTRSKGFKGFIFVKNLQKIRFFRKTALTLQWKPN